MDGLVTATLRTTPDTPVAGTPPWPVTWRSMVCPAPTGALKPPVPVRGSRIRLRGRAREFAGAATGVAGVVTDHVIDHVHRSGASDGGHLSPIAHRDLKQIGDGLAGPEVQRRGCGRRLTRRKHIQVAGHRGIRHRDVEDDRRDVGYRDPTAAD